MKYLPLTLILTILYGFKSYSQNTYVPDDNFEQVLIDLGYDVELNDSVVTDSINNVKILDLSNKDISDLSGVEDFAELQKLYCQSNQLIELNLSNNAYLEILNCSKNSIIDLDLSNNTFLKELSCKTNQLTGLNLKNGNNENLRLIDASDNDNLFCIQVDNYEQSYNKSSWSWKKNKYTGYTENCSSFEGALTYIPDDNFEDFLISAGYDKGDKNNYIPTISVRGIKNLAVVHDEIENLEGIKDFELLESLTCSYNKISELDLSSNQYLTTLICSHNEITSLEFSASTKLKKLDCTSNRITSIDLHDKLFLQELHCSSNKINDLDLSSNSLIRFVSCSNNSLTSLNLKNGNNSNMTVYASNNPDLFCIQVDDLAASINNTRWHKNGYCAYSEDCSSYVMEMTYVPDDNFEKALIEIGYDFGELNDSVPKFGISYLKKLGVTSKNITDFTGIEDFLYLQDLNCSYNELTALDLSNNVNLEKLSCYGNNLERLNCSNCSKLQKIDCLNNKLISLNLSNNNSLTDLYCGNNSIPELDLSECLNLKKILIGNNQLNLIDFSKNEKLTYISAHTNHLTDLDLSMNSTLEYVYLSDNRLTGLNLRNGNNANIDYFNAKGNENLFCIEVDDPIVSNTYKHWTKQAWTEYKESCDDYIPEWTYVPDDNFEKALIRSGYDLDAVNDSVPTAAIKNIESLVIKNHRISSLKGIEDFKSLKKLYCAYNHLEEIDLSNNIKLTDLEFYDNQLKDLDVSMLSNLERINCSRNELLELDLSNNKNVIYVQCSENPLMVLNVKNGNNENLNNLYAHKNPNLLCIQVDDERKIEDRGGWVIDDIASFSASCPTPDNTMIYIPDDNFEQCLIDQNLDVGPLNDSVPLVGIERVKQLGLYNKSISDLAGIEYFRDLEILSVMYNQLKYLDVSKNVNLLSLDCANNELEHLDVTNNINLTTLGIGFNRLKYIDLRKNKLLRSLGCYNNQIEELDLSELTELFTLRCNNNELSSLDISKNLKLYKVYCENNKLENLITSPGSYVHELFCSNNSLTSLDFSSSNFWYLKCDNNNLKKLNVKNGKNYGMNIDARNNSDLYCIQVDKADMNWIRRTFKKDAQCEFSEDCDYGCKFSISSENASNNFTAFTDTIFVNTDVACEWIANVDCDWVKIISENSGIGNDTVVFSVDENDTYLPRICKIVIENEEFIIEQEGITCDYELSGTQQTIDSDGGKSSVDITCEEECYWELAVNCDWVTITSEKSGNGNGIITFSVVENTDENERFCEMIIAGINYSVIQKGQQSTVPQIYPNDYNNLVNIFNSLGSEEWQNNTNWLDTINYNVSEWNGVTVENGYVTALDLSELNLKGSITHLFSEFDSLKWLNISNNNLTGSFSVGNLKKSGVFESVRNGSLNLEYLNIANNKFTFADLEPGANDFSEIREFIYSPQSDIQERYDTAVYKNQSLTLQPKNYIKGVHDSFIWKKDNEIVDGQNELYFEVQEVAYSDSGNYQLVISNELFPELKLHFQNHVSVLIPVGINEQSFSNYNIYPNPASDKIYIDTAGDIIDLKVFDQYGRIVLIENEIESGWFDINKLVDGSYVFKLISKDLLTVNRIVVVKQQ